MTQTRAQGMVWWKSPLTSGGDGKFHSRFAVIEKGILNFYRNEEVNLSRVAFSRPSY
jgi:hypothetical protein